MTSLFMISEELYLHIMLVRCRLGCVLSHELLVQKQPIDGLLVMTGVVTRKLCGILHDSNSMCIQFTGILGHQTIVIPASGATTASYGPNIRYTA